MLRVNRLPQADVLDGGHAHDQVVRRPRLESDQIFVDDAGGAAAFVLVDHIVITDTIMGEHVSDLQHASAG